MLFMGANTLATSLFAFGILGALASIFLMSDALRKTMFATPPSPFRQ